MRRACPSPRLRCQLVLTSTAALQWALTGDHLMSQDHMGRLIFGTRTCAEGDSLAIMPCTPHMQDVDGGHEGRVQESGGGRAL